MKVKLTIGICTAGLLALGANAADSETRPVAVGSATEAFLKMQREGTAPGQAQPVSGDVASRSYKRYLDSFTQPIRDSGQTAGSTSRPAASSSGTR